MSKYADLKYKQACSKRVEILLAHSNIPEVIMKNYNKFEDYKVNHTGKNKIIKDEVIKSRTLAKAEVMKYCKNISRNFETGKSLFLVGPGTTGKTVLACLVLKYAIKALSQDSYYVNFSTIVGETYTPFDYRSEHFMQLQEKYVEPSFLCIDEVDNIYATKHLQSFMTMVITARKDQNKPTIITSKISQDDIGFVLGDVVSNTINNGLDYDIIEIKATDSKVKRLYEINDEEMYIIQDIIDKLLNYDKLEGIRSGKAIRHRMGRVSGADLRKIINESR